MNAPPPGDVGLRPLLLAIAAALLAASCSRTDTSRR